MRILTCVILFGVTAIAYGQTPPDDSGRYHLLTITEPVPSPASVALLQSLATDPDLVQRAIRCKRFDFKATDPLYLQRYAEALPPTNLPIVALARSDGGVIFKASGPSIPIGKNLATALDEMAIADRVANPRVIPGDNTMTPDTSAQDCPTCPRQPQPFPVPQPRPFDGSRLPGIIPDTINITPTIAPQINAGSITMFVVGFVLLLFFGVVGLVVFVGVIAGVVMLTRN